MIDVKLLNPRTRVALVCLYFAQLKSDDNRYFHICHPTLKIIGEKYGIKYNTIKQYKDGLDSQFDNDRAGYYQSPLEKKNQLLRDVYEQYKETPISDLKEAVNQIVEECQHEDRSFFIIKTKEMLTVKSILECNKNIVFDGINILKDTLKLGQLVFVVLGGDNPKWETGLVAMGTISKEPYDDKKGKNFKVNVDIALLLDKPIKRDDLIPYKDTYEIIGIPPITQLEANQVISHVNEKNAVALMRAMLELSPNINKDLQKLISEEVYTRIMGASTKMFPVEVDFGEKLPMGIDDYEEAVEVSLYSKADFLNDVFIDEQSYNTICGLLDYKKNIIIEGAPGVGKTYAAKRLAYSILGVKDDRYIKTIQFHQSYSYEDFISGFRPTANGFELATGPFYDFCIKANKSTKKHFFIIDEINRGNLSKIFGELLMLIEADKRNEKIAILYKNEEFGIPENVYIIGMMNTADRSLAIIDYALRRRFSFFKMHPAFNTEGFKTILSNTVTSKFSKTIEIIKDLNVCIAEDDSLGEGFQIGHSYFCTNKAMTDETLKMIINYEIIPLLKEYWFDEKEKVSQWTKKLHGVYND